MKVLFKDGYAIGYKMALGEFFRAALEKEAFKTGDLIYDTREAYGREWIDALHYINYAFQVVSTTGDEVQYDILLINKKKDGLVRKKTLTASVSDFMVMLREGLPDGLER